MAGFRRSGAFGLIGVFVVAGIVLAIALNVDSRDADPKFAYGLIFGVIGLFMAMLFMLQASDVSRAEKGSGSKLSKLAGTSGREVADPTTLPEPDLWASLAISPITEDAIGARSEVWGQTRSSIRLGSIITVLIFAGVVPIYLLDTFVPLLICAPVIGLTALYKSFRIIGSGGDLDKGYDNLGRAMAPLGLAVVEKPKVMIEPRIDRPSMSARLRGTLAFEGERHGCRVSVRLPADSSGLPSSVELAGARPLFEVGFKRGRLRAEPGAPDGIGKVLGSLPASKRWKGVAVEGGPDGILVQRKSSGSGDWLCDLWLAERLASTVGA